MVDSIGNLYETKIPSFSEDADIQEALRIYHYGAPSGTGTGQYPIDNSEPTNLKPESIAYHLYNLQTQISNFASGIPPTAYTSKGVLISASQSGVIRVIDPGPNGQVLATNSSTLTGLEWQTPSVTPTNGVTLTNKTLSNSTISNTRVAASGLIFAGPAENLFTTTLILPTPSANKTVFFPATADTPASSTVLVGRDTVDTLTNKTIEVSQLDGQVAIANGGTGALNAATARSNLEIFNTQAAVTGGNDRTQYSGKIYVADPAIVGPNGANLDGAAAGDLWFW
jgi:hypothetical protein